VSEYDVVINGEEQYSVWPQGRELPAGWEKAGFRGSRQECLDHVAAVWTDMRPRGVRAAAEQARP
jgi:MbtH protein